MMTRTAAALVALLGFASTTYGGWKETSVDIQTPPTIATRGDETVLVALFRADALEGLDVGLEISRWVRRELGRETRLPVLDAPPPAIPEQRPEKLALNDPFWRRLGEDFKADLIVAGVAEFKVEDRSGFVSEDLTSPTTGQTVRRTRFAERRGYRLRIDAFFLKGDNGALLHADAWTEERLIDGATGDDLQELFSLLEGMKPQLLAVLLPTTAQEPRYIWVE